MTDNATLWRALQKYVPKKTWMPLADILTTVRSRVLLDKEDLERRRSPSSAPRWEFNVRRLLRAKTRAGSIRARKRTAGGG